MFSIEKTLMYYSADEMKELKKLCDSVCKKTGWKNGSVNFEGSCIKGVRIECDDLYDIANEVLWRSCESFDEKKGVKFKIYLTKNLKRKLDTYIRDNNVDKRIPTGMTISYDMETTEKHPLTETLTDGKSLEDIVFEDEKRVGRIDMFMDKISSKQKEIVELLNEGYTKKEITKHLGMTNSEYDKHMMRIQRAARILY